MTMRVCGEVLTRRFKHGMREIEEGKRDRKFSDISGSDHDGRGKGAGKYCAGSTRTSRNRYSGMWYGEG